MLRHGEAAIERKFDGQCRDWLLYFLVHKAYIFLTKHRWRRQEVCKALPHAQECSTCWL